METTKKRIYKTPQVERIRLDNEISLVLQSDGSPFGDPEANLQTKNNYDNNPFKINVG